MKVGLSSYSLSGALSSGEMDILGAMEWTKENGGDFIEVVPSNFTVNGNDELCAAVKQKSEEIGLPVAQYSVSGNVLKDDEKEYQAEVDRLKTEIDTAAKMGAGIVRHDLAAIPDYAYATTANFEKWVGRIIEAAKETAAYAKQYGIKTSIENHGIFVNGSENVIRIAEGVGMDNFGLTLDIGNFASVDERPEISVKRCIDYAVSVHFKDFYVKSPFALGSYADYLRSSGCYFTSRAGTLLRGAIVGMGELDLVQVADIIRSSSFDGTVTVEFEGTEECKFGSRLGIASTKALLGL